jgi:hypothetical protein
MPELLYWDERSENITRTLLRTVPEYLAHTLCRNMSWLRSRSYKLANTKDRWETASLLHDIRSSVFHTHIPKYVFSTLRNCIFQTKRKHLLFTRSQYRSVSQTVFHEIWIGVPWKKKIVDIFIKCEFSISDHTLRYCSYKNFYKNLSFG